MLILPQRNPVVLAKTAASLDVLSGGRTALGVGLGWMREEAEAVGTSFGDRGRRADEYIEASFLEWLARERVALEATTATDDLERMVAHLESTETELAAYRDANLVSVIGRDAYVAGLAERARAVEEARRDMQFLRDRRPETYGPLVNG